MSKRPFVILGILVVALAVVVPLWAFGVEGETSGPTAVPPELEEAQTQFVTNCGTCHALASAGTEGNFGPNLDKLLYPQGPPTGEGAADTIASTRARVLAAIEEGVNTDTIPGRMPPGILAGEPAEQVAEFVARTGGR